MVNYLKTSSAKQQDSAREQAVCETVLGVIADVRARGDVAVREYSEKFDRWSPERFLLSDEQIAKIVATVLLSPGDRALQRREKLFRSCAELVRGHRREHQLIARMLDHFGHLQPQQGALHNRVREVPGIAVRPAVRHPRRPNLLQQFPATQRP
ncbi:hypothetical protein GKO32_08615 [Amycolatopsis sp. RM579]|uniref:Histidinol dehydrogenase n=1 Tax=Amycolatopsis pithecellobii TaxID=664692 RepID=A0A6N7Z247_9PSEU|nr:histidinol dehydrogenase [Amycolatopsis pithecellobii]MTD54041.1 hypothetical protein [Amycolatopsis pithecellobii]